MFRKPEKSPGIPAIASPNPPQSLTILARLFLLNCFSPPFLSMYHYTAMPYTGRSRDTCVSQGTNNKHVWLTRQSSLDLLTLQWQHHTTDFERPPPG